MRAQGHQIVTRARYGADGVSSFKSVVFKRSNSTVDAPTGGSYSSPVPSGWSDGVPSGEEKLWMSTRIFTDTGDLPQQAEWTEPSVVTDTADIDFEFSASETKPSDPDTDKDAWHNEATSEDVWMAVRKKRNGVWGKWEISKIKGEKGKDGTDGKDGVSSFKSIVFKRSDTAVSAPTGGSYTSPVPSGWSDGVPDGEQRLWMSTRIFSSTGGAPQQSAWTTPQVASDTADIDFEFSAVASSPGTPTTSPSNWHNDATPSDIWMAVRKRSNGAWGSWEVSKIKGEKGDPGKDGTDGDQGYGIVANVTRDNFTEANWNTYGAIGRLTEWTGTEDLRNGCRVGDLFLTTGTATDTGNAHTVISRSTTSSGVLKGTVLSHYIAKKGEDGTDGTDGKDGKGISSQVEYYAVSSSNTTPPTSWTANTPPSMTSTNRYLWKYTLTTFTDGTTAKTTASVVGVYGTTGLSFRYSTWQSGKEYRNDNNPYYRDSNDKGFIDVVYTKGIDIFDSANPPAAYICQTTHTSGSSHPLSVGTDWLAMNSTAPILTALVLADRIKANFLDVENLAANSAFIDNLVVNKLIAGVQNGQRVEITPESKAMNIYDSSGKLVSSFEGNSYTDISSLFGSSSGSISVTNSSGSNTASAGMTGARQNKIIDTFVTSAVQMTKNAQITVGAGTLSISAVVPSTVSDIEQSFNADIYLRAEIYSDSSCNNLQYTQTIAHGQLTGMKSDGGTYNRSTSVSLAGKTTMVTAGYVRLAVYASFYAEGISCSCTCAWSGLSSVTYNQAAYVSRYFANGLCLGVQANNYIGLYKQSSGGMRALMENGGYGFDFSNNGIKFRRNSTEGFKSLIPKYGLPFAALAVGTMNLNSTSPSMGTYKTFDGGTISVSRSSSGTFRVTIPSSWGSSYIVQLTTLGRANSGNVVACSVYTISSGSFIVDTKTTGDTWVDEVRVMFLITRVDDFNV